jgi:hypothetical protein
VRRGLLGRPAEPFGLAVSFALAGLPWPVSSLLFFFILFSFLVLITVLATGYKTDAINNFENL